ncbi:MAG: hypothetical protein AB7O97_02625 [Planctomycetota bacterium]
MLRTAFLTALAASVAATLPAQNCFDFNLGTDLNLTDDGVASALPLGFSFTYGGVAYTDICVCSNGYLWLGPTSSGGDFSPTEAELLSGAPRICPLWTDMNPAAAGSGHVYYNTVPGFSATVTWAGVYEFGGTNAIEMQIVLDATGAITVTYGPNAAVGGTLSANVIVGASPGGGAASNPVSFATRPVVIAQDTFAEVFPTTGATPIPLAGFQMSWVPTAPGFLASDNSCVMGSFPRPAAFDVVGAGCPPFAGGLDAGDDSTHALNLPFAFPHNSGPVSSIYASSNGFITLGATNPGSGCCSGSVTTLLAGAPRIAGFWQDLNCSNTSTSGNGDLFAHTDPATGDFVVTWENVGEFGDSTPAANNFQIALGAGGDIKIRYLNVGITNATRVALCGYSAGGGAVDPGALDLSASSGLFGSTLYETFSNSNNVLDLSGLDFLLLPLGAGDYMILPGAAGAWVPPPAPVQPLTLAAAPGSLPQVGGNFTLDISGIAAAPAGNVCGLLLSLEAPPIDLGFLGATGCTAMLVLPELAAFVNLPLGAPTSSFAFAIPANPTFYGVQVMTQAVSDDPAANAFGWRVSNGGRWTFGL